MKKSKSMLVTAIVLIMFAAIYGGLFLLYKQGFILLTGLLTAYGLLRSTLDFYHWLSEDAPEKPVANSHTEKQVDHPKQISQEKHRPTFFDIDAGEQPEITRRQTK